MTFVDISESEVIDMIHQAASLAKRAGLTKTKVKNLIEGVYKA